MDKWTRKKIKQIAKSRMKSNYWKAVLVAAILMLLAGTSGTAASGVGGDQEVQTSQDSKVEMVQSGEEAEAYSDDKPEAAMIILFVLLFLTAGSIVVLLTVFIVNPLIVGGSRFFYQNLDKNAEVREVCYTFDRGYKNAVKTMFFRDLYTILWMLLFIIPGIIKSYEYTLIPYLLAENENMTKAEAFAESKRLMKGNKWRAFVLDMSLIPWILLSAVTFGIAGFFYAYPYFYSISAAFYQAVKEEDLFRVIGAEQ